MVRSLRSRSRATALLAAVVVLALGGCGQDAPEAAPSPSATSAPPSPAPSEPAPPAQVRAAVATGAQIGVHDAPDGAQVAVLDNPIPSGAPLTFLVTGEQGAWVQVQLAQRPNGSVGWVHATEVQLQGLSYALEVSTASNTLTLLQDGAPVRTYDVATGTGGTPTPVGSFYLNELLAPTNDGYGPYAFGVSAFSTVLNEFGGGPGQIGLHGTDDEGSIGAAASHGCIRMRNDDITELAMLLPLGTPITIT